MAGKVTITWTNSETADTTNSVIYRDDQYLAEVPVANPSVYEDNSPTPGANHKYEVQAVNSVGVSTDEVLNENVSYVQIPGSIGLKPIMTNFRIEDANPDRVYFDTPLGSVAGIDYTKFIITDKTITGVDTTSNYFTVSSGFNHYNNNTIRQEGGNGVVYDFKLQFIVNNIVEPDAPIDKYVESGASGNGSSIGSPASLTYACANAVEGETWHVKAGDYGTDHFTVANSGTVNSPIKFIGYESTPGDNPKWTFSTTINLSPSKMPYINGGYSSTDTDGGFRTGSRNYIIVKNFQIEGFYMGFDAKNGSFQVWENCYAQEAWRGFSCYFADNSENIRMIDCWTSNMRGGGATLSGARCLMEGCWSSSNFDAGMDYQLVMNASNHPDSGQHIMRNCYMERSLDQASHTGHGITFYGTYHRKNRFSLVEHCEVVNVRQVIENRGHGVEDCVYRDLNCYQTANDPVFGRRIQIGITNTSGIRGWFERVSVRGYDDNGIETAIRFLSSRDDPNAEDAGNSNTFVNCTFERPTYCIRMADDGNETNEACYNNEVINCTFTNASYFFRTESYNDVGTGNKVINSIINNVTARELRSYTNLWTFENCDFWNSWTNGEGTGAFNVDPQFDSNYVPTAPFTSLQVAKNSEVDYDENKLERANPTTVGAKSSKDEKPQSGDDNLVINGDFSQGSSYWSIGGGTSNIANGEATIETTTSFASLYQESVMTTGQDYTVEFDVVETNGETLASELDEIVWDTSTVGHKTQVITAPDTKLFFKRRVGSTDTRVVLDNISVKV